jgi:hypothetical protein
MLGTGEYFLFFLIKSGFSNFSFDFKIIRLIKTKERIVAITAIVE